MHAEADRRRARASRTRRSTRADGLELRDESIDHAHASALWQAQQDDLDLVEAHSMARRVRGSERQLAS